MADFTICSCLVALFVISMYNNYRYIYVIVNTTTGARF